MTLWLQDAILYFTNDHSDEMGALRTIKDFLLIGTGSVGHYDGNTVKILANDIRYANGITIDRDSKNYLLQHVRTEVFMCTI